MSSLSVDGKYAVITGAGSGINLAFARLLLSRGCCVLIGDLSLRPEAKQLLAEYAPSQTSGGSGSHPKKATAHFHPTDVTSWPQLSALWSKALEIFPQVDIVVPGAGIFEPPWSTFWNPPRSATNPDSPSVDRADAEVGSYKTLNVNLTHPIRLSQLGIGYWTTKKMPGCLVHISSVAGYAASCGSPLYHASKFGLIGFVRSLASLKSDLGIRVSAVCPGVVNTPMWTEERPDQIKDIKGLLIDPQEIAVGMLELCENPKYGAGTVLEVARGKSRVVPQFNAPEPSGEAALPLDGYRQQMLELIAKLKNNGLKL